MLVLYVAPAKGSDYTWTFFMPNPSVTTGSLVNLSTQEQYYERTVRAPSLSEALDDAQFETTRHVSEGSLEDIVLASTLTAPQVVQVIHSYNRLGSWPETAYVVVVNPGRQPFPISTHQPVPDVYYTRYFECRHCQPLDLSRREWKIWDDYVTPGVSTVIPYANDRRNPSQLAVYTRSKVVFLSPSQTVGWAILTNHVSSLAIGVKTPMGRVVVRGVRTRTRVTVRKAGGSLHAAVRVSIVGNLVQWPMGRRMTPKDVREIDAAVSHHVLDVCRSTINAGDRFGIDPVGFGRKYFFGHPGEALYADRHYSKVWPVDTVIHVSSRVVMTGVNS
jgi:hypothetical protein